MYSIMLPIHLNKDRKPEDVLSVVREAKAECVILAFDDIILSADGVSVEGIAKLMAGNTRPLIRLIGASYWATGQSWGNRLQHTVELERMECAFIEIRASS